MKLNRTDLLIIAFMTVLVAIGCTVAEEPPLPKEPPKLQSDRGTNAQPVQTDEAKLHHQWTLGFQQGVIYGTAALARNPDLAGDHTFLIRTAYKLMQADQARKGN